jgi:hypothetical protein
MRKIVLHSECSYKRSQVSQYMYVYINNNLPLICTSLTLYYCFPSTSLLFCSDNTIRVTLWASRALQFSHESVYDPNQKSSIVALFVGCLPKEFRGSFEIRSNKLCFAIYSNCRTMFVFFRYFSFFGCSPQQETNILAVLQLATGILIQLSKRLSHTTRGAGYSTKHISILLRVHLRLAESFIFPFPS